MAERRPYGPRPTVCGGVQARGGGRRSPTNWASRRAPVGAGTGPTRRTHPVMRLPEQRRRSIRPPPRRPCAGSRSWRGRTSSWEQRRPTSPGSTAGDRVQAFRAAPAATAPVTMMCRVPGGRRGGYSRWQQRPPQPLPPRTQRHQAVTAAILALFAENKGRLATQNIRCSPAWCIGLGPGNGRTRRDPAPRTSATTVGIGTGTGALQARSLGPGRSGTSPPSRRGLALSGGGARPRNPGRGRLGVAAHAAHRACRRRPDHGVPAAPAPVRE